MKRTLSGIRPRRVVLQVTDRCDARCRHCGYEGSDDKRGLLDLALAEKFLEAFERHWGPPERIGLTGGEPMLHEKLTLALVKLAAGRGLTVRLLTNAGWAKDPASARHGVDVLRQAGLSGFWVSAGAYHNEWIAPSSTRYLVEAAERAGAACYLNFAYLHPKGDALRGKGLPEIHEDVPDDAKTFALHRAFAGAHPAGTHGWARIWDMGRARALFDALGDRAARRARADLARAAALGKGDLLDLVGLGIGGAVFFREAVIGRSPSGGFDRLLRRIYPRGR